MREQEAIAQHGTREVLRVFLQIFCAFVIYFFGFAREALAFTFSPTRIFVEALPGTEQAVTIDITNETAREAIANVSVATFRSSGEAGKPLFTNEKLSTSLAPFVVLSNSQVRLASDEKRAYRFSVKVPKDAKPGSYYGAIHFAFAPADGGVGATAITGPLVFLNIGGEAESALSIAQVEAPQGFFGAVPTHFSVDIQNDGDVVEVPVGEVKVRNLFGTAVRTYTVNGESGAILPGETRKFSVGDSLDRASLWGEFSSFGVGPYTVEVSVMGKKNERVSLETPRFWVFPWRLAALGFLVVLIFATILGFLFPRTPRVPRIHSAHV